jgi:heat shock protein HtpX
MAVAKRIFLFLLTNILVISVITIILNVLGIQPYLTKQGIDYKSLAIFCLIWGMGGAFISLAISRIMAKWMMGVQVIDPAKASGTEKQLVSMVYQLAQKAGLSKMPEVGIYNSPEVNAFATGPTQSRSLVAVSSGLLSRMNQDEVEAILGHEVSHIANGDMVTMTLLQGVVNAFVMFLARVLAFALSRAFSRDREEEGFSSLTFNLMVIVFEVVFMILGSMVVAAYSRHREFRADAGGARLAGKEKMISALQSLQRTFDIKDDNVKSAAFQSMKISGGGGFMKLFSTHPPIPERIDRLRKQGY